MGIFAVEILVPIFVQYAQIPDELLKDVENRIQISAQNPQNRTTIAVRFCFIFWSLWLFQLCEQSHAPVL